MRRSADTSYLPGSNRSRQVQNEEERGPASLSYEGPVLCDRMHPLPRLIKEGEEKADDEKSQFVCCIWSRQAERSHYIDW